MSFKMNQFRDEVVNAVKAILGESAVVTPITVAKNNGTAFQGITVAENHSGVSPVIYLEKYFEEYCYGKTIAKIAADICMVYRESKLQEGFNVKRVMDFDRIRDRIVYQVINAEMNEERLKDIPHICFLDLAMVFRIYFGDGDGNLTTALVENRHAELWGISLEELYCLASVNTPFLFPAACRTIREILMEELGGQMDIPEEETGDKDSLYVLTNTVRISGASVICYKGQLQRKAEKFGTDILILPSSIHETLLLPDHGERIKDLEAIVSEINEAEVALEDRLSYHVYRYRRNTGLIEYVNGEGEMVYADPEGLLENRKGIIKKEAELEHVGGTKI